MLIKFTGNLARRQQVPVPVCCRKCGKALHKGKHEVCGGCQKSCGRRR